MPSVKELKWKKKKMNKKDRKTQKETHSLHVEQCVCSITQHLCVCVYVFAHRFICLWFVYYHIVFPVLCDVLFAFFFFFAICPAHSLHKNINISKYQKEKQTAFVKVKNGMGTKNRKQQEKQNKCYVIFR